MKPNATTLKRNDPRIGFSRFAFKEDNTQIKDGETFGKTRNAMYLTKDFS